MSAKTIFFGNYKGGVGKTTSVFSVAYFMASEHGKRVLMIDIDPQSSLSEICLKNRDKEEKLHELFPNETLNYVFDLSVRKIQRYPNISLNIDASKMIKNCKYDKMSFIPTSLQYEDYLGLDELSMRMTNTIEYFAILPQFLNNFRDYDYILIDCPPTSNIITQSAFLSSDYYVIPTIEDGISTNGVIHYIETVNNTYNKYCVKPSSEKNYMRQTEDYLLYKHFFGERPKLLGIFYTLSRGQVDYDVIETEFREALNKVDIHKEPPYIFRNYTDNYVDIARQIALGNVAGSLNGKESGYKKITEELLNLINA